MSGHRRYGSDYQEHFLDGLRKLKRDLPRTLLQVAHQGLHEDVLVVRLALSTREMRRSTGGMPAHPEETVLVAIPTHPMAPPRVFVDHARFLGVPHVLSDGQLCVYLDPAREWDPAAGPLGFLDRLYRWFEDALADRFDPDTALFHAVGGLQYSRGTVASVVCREDFDDPRPLSLAWLSSNADGTRLDLRRAQRDPGDEQVLVLRMPGPLYTGPGRTFAEILAELDDNDASAGRTAWESRVRRRSRHRAGSIHFVVSVPHPTSPIVSLLVGRVDLSGDADAPAPLHRSIEWSRLYDERPSISTRRDEDRPVNAFRDSDVVLLGCGGLGSWIAEYVVRAGCRSIELVDYGAVSGGHLVRQNFTEGDVTSAKVPSLAARLRAINPALDITEGVGSTLSSHALQVLTKGGFIIDATVSIAMATLLRAYDLHQPNRRAFLAQVATDVATGSLGMVVVDPPGSPAGIQTVDAATGVRVAADGNFEPYRTFWDPSEDDELVPARGCSVPTFHGSAADLAAVAAIQVNIIGRHSGINAPGTYLFALPHTGVAPHYAFVPHEPAQRA